MNQRTADTLQKASSLLSEDSCFLCGGRIAHADDCIMNDVERYIEHSRIGRIRVATDFLFNNGFTCIMDNDCIYDVKQTEVAPDGS